MRDPFDQFEPWCVRKLALMCFGRGPGGGTTGTEQSLTNLIGQEQAQQGEAFRIGLPVEQQVTTGGTGLLPQAEDFTSGITAQGFAPAAGALNRQLAAAGIDPNSAAAIQAQTNLRTGEGQAFANNLFQQLMNNFAAKTGAAQNLISFGQARDPLSALGLLSNIQLQA
jgi:hypothetical protein